MKIHFHLIFLALLPASVSALKENTIAVKTQTAAEPKFLRGMGNRRRGLALVNDECSGAQELRIGQVVTGNITEANVDNPDELYRCGGYISYPSVWYKVVGTGCALIADTCGSSFTNMVQVLTGSCDGLTCVPNDHKSWTSSCGYTDKVIWNTQKGQEYFIFVGGDRNNHVDGSETMTDGKYQLNVLEVCPRANDNVCSAEPMTMSTPTYYSTLGATVEVGEVTPGIGTSDSGSRVSQDGWWDVDTDVQNSVWFEFSPEMDRCVDIFIDQADDMQLALWKAEACSDFTTFMEVAANDDKGKRNRDTKLWDPRIINAKVHAGEHYYIQLDGFDGTHSSGYITIEQSVDVTIPVVECIVESNRALMGTGSRYNRLLGIGSETGYFKLVGSDGCSDVGIFVEDSGSGTKFGPFPNGTSGAKFGPFPNGTVIKYIKDVDNFPSVVLGKGANNGDVDYIINGKGNARLSAVDRSGNVSEPADCQFVGQN